MRRGWFRENWRHALAARGYKTTRYAYASRGPLISNHEIYKIEARTGKKIGSLQEHEIQHHVGEIRKNESGQPRMSMAEVAPVKDKTKMDWFEPFRGADEKTNDGKEVIEDHISQKKMEIRDLMKDSGADPHKISEIMTYDLTPIIEDYRTGKNKDEKVFDDNMLTAVKSRMPVKEGKDRFPNDHGEHGSLNFIDKAAKSKGW